MAGARPGQSRSGKAGVSRRGRYRRVVGFMQRGKSQRGRIGEASRGRRGKARQAWFSLSRTVRRVKAGSASLVSARHVRSGQALLGIVSPGKADQCRHGFDG
jgi:hypothetical protein